MSEYPYVSYNEYTQQKTIVDTEFALGMMSKKEFISFNSEENVEQFLALEIDKRNWFIKFFKEKGMSLRQISRLTGISFGIVRRIK